MAAIDPSTDHGQRVLERLENEQAIWLTTVGKSGAPHPRPLWFVWQHDAILISSQPGTAKLRHHAGNNRVALNFNSSTDGGDVAVISGTAAMFASGWLGAWQNSARRLIRVTSFQGILDLLHDGQRGRCCVTNLSERASRSSPV